MHIADDLKQILEYELKRFLDPNKLFYKTKEETMPKPIRVKAIHNTDYDTNSRNMEYDPILESFAIGSVGQLSKWEKEKYNRDNVPLVMRGLATDSQRAIKHCQSSGIDFYTIDTGYIQPGTKKEYHRVTKNALQNLGPIIERDNDRLKKLNWNYREPKLGNKILICPPSAKVMKFYGEDLDAWLKNTIDTLKTLTNKPIEIRVKPSREQRVTTNTIWQALEDTYCLITYNSIAATEAMLYSVPAIALAPNAATVICNTQLSDIKNPYLPTKKEIGKFAAHLSYCQFTQKEMLNGFAWKIVNEGS